MFLFVGAGPFLDAEVTLDTEVTRNAGGKTGMESVKKYNTIFNKDAR